MNVDIVFFIFIFIFYFFGLRPWARVQFLYAGYSRRLDFCSVTKESICDQLRCVVGVREVGLKAVRIEHGKSNLPLIHGDEQSYWRLAYRSFEKV